MKKILVLLVMILSLPATADYKIDWHTIDGGGGRSSGGDYAVVGTIGQADTGEMSGGGFSLSGGFWPNTLFQQCFVDFEHFARFAIYWLDAPCNASNNWCFGSDLDSSGDVTVSDLNEVVYFWLDYCPTNWPWE